MCFVRLFSSKRKCLFLSFVFIFFIIIGCASKGLKSAGFLRDYSSIKQSGERKGLYIDRSRNYNISSYSKIMIDPVVVYFGIDAKGQGVAPGQLKKFSDFLYDELVKAFDERFTLVENPGEGVLRLRTAITDVLPSKIYLNLHWSTAAAGFGIGGAAMEAEFVDATTDRRVLAVVDSRKGQRAKYFNGLKKWKHTENVFKQWAKLLVEMTE